MKGKDLYLLYNIDVFSDKVIRKGSVLFDNNTILSVTYTDDSLSLIEDKFSNLYNNIVKINGKGKLVSPGFVDLQINGAGGVLFNNDISIESIDKIYITSLSYGVTSILPTLISTDIENIKKAISVAIDYYNIYPYRILGIHIEGPFLSVKKKGTHDSSKFKVLEADFVDYLVDKVAEIPIKLTLAPEVNDIKLVKKLISSGIKISLGHSNASYEEIVPYLQAGVSMVTHLFNAMSPLSSRELGLVGTALYENNIYAGIIVDGFHVDYRVLELVLKLKTYNKLYLITDAMSVMGTKMNSFYLDNELIIVKNGRCLNKEGNLAGSSLNMLQAINNTILHCRISLNQALSMATIIPLTVMNNHFDKLGKIASGYIPNLVILDTSNNILKIANIIVQGTCVYQNLV